MWLETGEASEEKGAHDLQRAVITGQKSCVIYYQSTQLTVMTLAPTLTAMDWKRASQRHSRRARDQQRKRTSPRKR